MRTVTLLLLWLAMGGSAAAEIRAIDPQQLANLSWLDGQGQRHHLDESHGRPRILHFWAAWCVPCRRELPDLLRWQTGHPEVEVILLSLDQRRAQTEYFIHKYGLTMPPLLLEQTTETPAIPLLPYSVFIDGNGRLLAHREGAAPWGEAGFDAGLAQLFAAPPAAASVGRVGVN